MLEILRPGVQTSVQDRGRHGLRHLGIARSGALDMPALYRANCLVGNSPEAAGLEIVLGPVSLRLGRDAWLALSGADFHPALDGQPIGTGWRTPAKAGQILTLSGCEYGMRTYLAIDGGLAVPEALGACATDLQAGFGGFQGRARDGRAWLPGDDATTGSRWLRKAALLIHSPIRRIHPCASIRCKRKPACTCCRNAWRASLVVQGTKRRRAPGRACASFHWSAWMTLAMHG